MPAEPTAKHNAAPRGVQMLEITERHQDQRLDNFLLGRLKGVPKTRIYRIIRKGEVRVNGKRAKPELRLEAGDVVRVPPLRLPEQGKIPLPGKELQARLKAAILYEDQDLIVLNKPSGMPVHAGTGNRLGLIETLRAMFPDAPGLELVHRLDKGTSGCLLLALNGRARKALMDDFRRQQVHKRYHLLVAGDWPETLERVDLPLQRQPEQGGERRVEVDEAGKSASTAFRVLRRFGRATLLEACPATGRTHQIRVHAGASGFPLLGDDKYSSAAAGALSRELSVTRLCLHAAELEFRHPASGALVAVSAPYEDSFRRVLTRLQAAD